LTSTHRLPPCKGPLMKTTSLALRTLLYFLLIPISGATGLDYSIYVANKNSPAHEVATSRADGKSVFLERSMQKALNIAATLAADGHSVTVMVASGEYGAGISAGSLSIPKI